MILMIVVPLALLAGVVRGGSMANVATLPLRGVALVALALGLQIALYLPGIRSSALTQRAGWGMYVCSLALIVAFMLRNWGLGSWIRLAALGLSLNVAAILANGGHMPTDLSALRALRGGGEVRAVSDRASFSNTRPATARTRLTPLTDVIPIPVPPGAGNVYSVGDILLAVGVAGLAYRATRGQVVASPDRGAGG